MRLNSAFKGRRPGLTWSNPTLRSWAWQALVVALLVAAVAYLVSNTMNNLESRNIATGFAFLHDEAGFAIGETPIAYSPSDTYGRAIAVGLLNTLRVSVIAIIAATVLGTLVGVARLSQNWLLARLAGLYVEVVRNTPLLLHLFFWYAVITQNMPHPRQAYHPLPGVFVSNRGITLPQLEGAGLDGLLGGLALAILLLISALLCRNRSAICRLLTRPALAFAGLLVLPALGWWMSGAPIQWDVPRLAGFNFRGGLTLSPEFAALLGGLILYTTAFIAEVVRSGIQAVSRGQWEAAASLGLPRRLVLRLVVLPQALRVIVPPMASQYLNITKNSSLAVAIGYPDLVSVVNTTLNQTGQAIEGILIIMAAYLTVSLSISLFMNWYNRRITLVER